MDLTRVFMLPMVLRVVAVLIACAITLRFVLLDSILPVPFVIIVILVVLSFTCNRWPRASAIASIILSVLVPVMVLLGYLNGSVELALVIFDWIVFIWIIISAIRALRLTN